MLERQISRHEKSMQEVECVLKNAVCESVVETLKAQLAEVISDLIAKEVLSRVQQEVDHSGVYQIPLLLIISDIALQADSRKTPTRSRPRKRDTRDSRRSS